MTELYRIPGQGYLVGWVYGTEVNPRGHLLGGSSSMNYMVYSRGSSDDWNQYAEVTGDIGWSWDSVRPYFQKVRHPKVLLTDPNQSCFGRMSAGARRRTITPRLESMTLWFIARRASIQ